MAPVRRPGVVLSLLGTFLAVPLVTNGDRAVAALERAGGVAWRWNRE